MTRYVIGRLLESVLVLALMSFVIYALIALMPGDPIDIMVQSNPDLTPEDAARLKALYGLDKPIFERYWNWLTAAAQGDFGYSRIHSRPVLEVMGPRLANTGVLMGLALLLSLAIALPVGIYSALKPYSASDYAINFVALAGISVPVFWLALMLIVVFAVTLNWLPAGGMESIGGEAEGLAWLLDRARYLVLPVIALSVASIGGLTRYVRAAMMEVMRQDYIRTARAKGASRARVVLRHALRNAMIPVVTILALSFGTLFSGALVTETMFSYLGMGKLIYDSIIGNDYNMALVSLMFATALVLASNLLADLCYAGLDPRVSYR
ncbi:MAG: ABC transporter permease [Alphaproteobacteria bacterium]|jgi:peptide/nickel transport system permease protein|nr:ABC transporter permease [Alphaproteobacteria bacterium]